MSFKKPISEYTCTICNKHFDKEGEEVYLIVNLAMKKAEVTDTLHWEWVKPEEHFVSRVFSYFHRDCFEVCAGTEYLSKRIPKVKK